MRSLAIWLLVSLLVLAVLTMSSCTIRCNHMFCMPDWRDGGFALVS